LRSIFDILTKNGSLNDEIIKIHKLFTAETITINDNDLFGGYQISLKKYIDSHLFRNWSYRGTCISIDEAIHTISVKEDLRFWQENECFLYLEFLINMVNLFAENVNRDGREQIYTIIHNIRIILERCNKYIKKVDDRHYILEKDSLVSSAVDILDTTQIAIPVIAYNYISNVGNIPEKQTLLRILANDFESRKSKLNADSRYTGHCSDLGFLFNNLNLRHNNDGSSRVNIDFGKISDDELEKYYDMTYRRYLMAVLACEELDTRNIIDALKKKQA